MLSWRRCRAKNANKQHSAFYFYCFFSLHFFSGLFTVSDFTGDLEMGWGGMRGRGRREWEWKSGERGKEEGLKRRGGKRLKLEERG